MTIPDLNENVDTFNADTQKYGGYQYSTNAPLSAQMANMRLSQAGLEIANFSDKKVIDIGCGDGTYTIELYDKASPQSIHGIDPAPNAVSIANEKVQERNITFSVENAYKLPYADNTYDIAYIRGVLHHMEHPQLAIQEALRVAKEIIVIEPNGYNPVLKIIEKISPYHIQHEEKSYPGYLLNRWIRESGGSVKKGAYVGLVPMFCPDWLAKIAKKLEPIVEAIPIVRHISCAVYVFSATQQDQ